MSIFIQTTKSGIYLLPNQKSIAPANCTKTKTKPLFPVPFIDKS
ncbi:MAG: hypothetical protein ACI4J4_08050 [Ruminiclostridium sp.]